MPLLFTVSYTAIWNIAACVALFVYCKHLFKTFHWSFALASSYTIFHGLFYIAYINIFEPYNIRINIVLTVHFYEALSYFLISLFVMEKVKPKEEWLGWLCFINVIVTILLMPVHIPGRNWLVGLSINPSMNGAIIAITLPFVYVLPRLSMYLGTIVVGVFLIFYSNCSTPVIALLAAIATPCFFYFRRKWLVVILLLALTCVLAYTIPDFSNSTGRVGQWVYFFKYWKDNFNWLIGSGNGSFYVFGPTIQYAQTKHLNEIFLWMHNDPLQTLFELGIMGFLLWGIAIANIALRLNGKWPWLAAGGAWLATSLTYYPLHFPIQLWLGLMIATVAIKKEK